MSSTSTGALGRQYAKRIEALQSEGRPIRAAHDQALHELGAEAFEEYREQVNADTSSIKTPWSGQATPHGRL